MTGRGTDEPDDPQIEDGRATLLCAPRGDGSSGDACLEHLTPDDGSVVDLLMVSFSGNAEERLGALRGRGITVDRVAVATVDGSVAAGEVDRAYAVESIQSMDRLSDLGMYVRDVVTDWAYDGNPSVVCFDAVDDLIDRSGLEVTFEFLLVLIEGVRPWGVDAHFHFDPAAHDGETRRTLEPLFDDVVHDEH